MSSSGPEAGIRARRQHGSEVNTSPGHHLNHQRNHDDLSHHRRHIRQRLKERSKIPGHVKWMKWMNSSSKNHTVAVIGEFVGTTLFLFFAFAGTQVANIGAGQTVGNSTTGESASGFNPATLLYIALSFGFSLTVNAWVFFRISGGLFNPAVTLALAILGDVPMIRAILLVIAQLSGACLAAILVKVLFPVPFNVQTTLGGGTSKAQGVFIEAFCTAELVFTIIMLAKEKHKATFIAPVGIGLALFIGELVAVYYTGGSLNPARTFGPAAISHTFEQDHWIYWIGPALGSLFAVIFYKLMKVLEYEMANPGQDGDEENDPTKNPELEVAQLAQERSEVVEELQEIEHESGLDAIQTEGDTLMDEAGNVGDAAPARKVEKTDNVGKRYDFRPNRTAEDLEAQWPSSQ